jgi:serine/threonine-protein phosphatase 5
LSDAEKIVRKHEFEKALAYDEPKTVVDQIHFDTMLIEDDYDGLRWEDDRVISAEFIQDMIQRFEGQKKLHKRYCYRVRDSINSNIKRVPLPIDIPKFSYKNMNDSVESCSCILPYFLIDFV